MNASLDVPAKRGRLPMAASLVSFIVYAVNVLSGKAAVSLGWNVPWRFGDVSEFLIVLACVVFFVIAIVERETPAAEDQQ